MYAKTHMKQAAILAAGVLLTMGSGCGTSCPIDSNGDGTFAAEEISTYSSSAASSALDINQLVGLVGCQSYAAALQQAESTLMKRGVRSFKVEFAGRFYDYEDLGPDGAGSSSACTIFSIDTANARNHESSSWSNDLPRIAIHVCFTGYDRTVGIPGPLVIDLSDPDSVKKVSVGLNVSTPETTIVGQRPLFANYGGEALTVANWAPGTTGTLEVLEFSPDSGEGLPQPDAWDIRLTDVRLKKQESSEDPAAPAWPDEVHIIEARTTTSNP